MRIPWKKNAKSTTGSTNSIINHHHSSTTGTTINSADKIGTTEDSLKMMMTMNHSSNNNNTTTPIKPQVTANFSVNHIPASPTSLGSGHYSPIDGSVKVFSPSPQKQRLQQQQRVVVANAAATTTTTTTTPLVSISIFERNESDLLLGTSTLINLRSNDDDDDEVYDVFLTPLQSASSAMNLDESESGGGNDRNSTAAATKTIPLMAAESTLTDDTIDATVDDNDDDIGSPEESFGPVPPMLLVSATDETVVPDTIRNSVPPPPPAQQQQTSKSPKFLRHASSFLRVSDLIGLDPTMDLSEHSDKSIPNYHCCSDAPPPGIPHDHLEKWVALNDGCNEEADSTTTSTTTTSSSTPIAQFAVDALAATALATIFDTTMWIPDAKTAKIIDSKPPMSWQTSTFQPQPNSTTPVELSSLEDQILIWSGNFRHGLYGSDIPAIRSAAIIQMSAEQLLHLLMDSNRVKEYNAMSLGRTDLLTLPCRHIVTKVMRSESRPPLLRKTLQFTSIFHARKLVDDRGNSDENDIRKSTNDNDSYLLVTRAVENPSVSTNADGTTDNNNAGNVIVSEILLGVNVIRTIPTSNNNSGQCCLLLSVNHVRSPMVPLYIAKRLGLQAATNFVHDLRKCC